MAPLISEMQRNINNIIFIQGIPENQNEDSFIDTTYPSLIVIDDLMRALQTVKMCANFSWKGAIIEILVSHVSCKVPFPKEKKTER